MANMRGLIPTHVKRKHFDHPGTDHPIIQTLESIEDPRKPSLFLCYPLTSILFMTLVTVICGATDWPKVIVMAQGMKDWLAKYVDMKAGIPCERTFKNVMNMLSPEALEKALRDIAAAIQVKKGVISIDGQTSRGTADRNLRGIHLVNAWSAENGICLAQSKVDDKSNEITAVPELMDMLDLRGAIITTDALNTQKTIAAKASEKGSDYLLPVKSNHPLLMQQIQEMFQVVDEERAITWSQWKRALGKAKEHRDEQRLQHLLENGASSCGAFFWQTEPEKCHGRIEIRKGMAISAEKLPLKNEWENIKTLVRIERERILEDKVESEVIYYIPKVF